MVRFFKPSVSSFYILLSMFILCSLFYYMGEIVNIRWAILYTVHDFHRMLFFAPIVYAAYVFGTKATLIISLLTMAVFIPRLWWISPYPDPTFRAIFFCLVSSGIGYLIANLRKNER